MPIAPLGGVAAVPTSALDALQNAQAARTASAAAPVTATDAAGGSGFGAALSGAVDNVQALQENANTLAVQAVTGNLDDIADATIAAARAQVTMQLVSTVRNKGVDAFNQIMNMQA